MGHEEPTTPTDGPRLARSRLARSRPARSRLARSRLARSRLARSASGREGQLSVWYRDARELRPDHRV